MDPKTMLPALGFEKFYEFHSIHGNALEATDKSYDSIVKSLTEAVAPPESDKKVCREFLNLTASECVDLHKSYTVRIVNTIVNSQVSTKSRKGISSTVPCLDGYLSSSKPDENTPRIVLAKLPLQIGTRWWREHMDLVVSTRQNLYKGLADIVDKKRLITRAVVEERVFTSKETQHIRKVIDYIQEVFYSFFKSPAPRYTWNSNEFKIMVWELLQFLEARYKHALADRDRAIHNTGMFVVSGMEKVFVTQEVPNRRLPFITSSGSGAIRQSAVRQSGFKGRIRLMPKHTKAAVLVCQITHREHASQDSEDTWESCDINVFHLYKMVISYIVKTQPSLYEHKVNNFYEHISSFFHTTTSSHIEILSNTLRAFLDQKEVSELGGKSLSDVEKIAYQSVAKLGIDGGDIIANMAYLLATALEYLIEQPLVEDRTENKRYLCAGVLLRQGFDGWLKLPSTQTRLAEIHQSDGNTSFKSTMWKMHIKKLMKEQSWNIYGTKRTGVVQQLSKMSTIDTISHLRRIDVPRDDNVATPEMRNLNSSHIGFVCCAETPDSMDVGIVKQFAMFAVLSIQTLYAFELRQRLIEENLLDNHADGKVFIDDMYVGNSSNTDMIVSKIRQWRLEDPKYRFVSVILVDNRVHLHCDAGRFCRPLLRWDAVKKLGSSIQHMTMNMLLEQGVMEYLDAYEIQHTYIAVPPVAYSETAFTHIELDPLFVGGIPLSLVPFAGTNHMSRNLFQCNMSRQAMEYNPMAPFDITRKLSKTLVTAQKPICVSRTFDKFMSVTSNGMNVVVAVLTGGVGCNQEDSLIFNKRSIDMGLFLNMRVNNVDIELPADYKIRTDITILEEGIDCGLLQLGRLVELGTVLAYVETVTVRHKAIRSDISKPGFLRSISVVGVGKHKYLRISIERLTFPKVGDKFASRYSQKGVIGSIVEYHDMPYSQHDGTVPDIVINPHAFPSRMTIGHIIETFFSTAYLLESSGSRTVFGTHVADKCVAPPDATPFTTDKSPGSTLSQDMIQQLQRGVAMIDPSIGVPMLRPVFMGVCFYQCLKHQVIEKSFSSGIVGRQKLTLSKKAGVSKGGGLRVGEMEKDALNDHGATAVVNEMFNLKSDRVSERRCECCMQIMTTSNNRDARCSKCGADAAHIDDLDIPSSLRTLVNIFEAVGIQTLTNTK